MLYFAYGSNLLTHRLEKRIGAVEIVGVGKLYEHRFEIDKLSRRDGSLKADAYYTGNPEEYVFGVIFSINPASKAKLDKEEGLGKGYDEKNITVELIRNAELVEVFTYIASKPDLSGKNSAYAWYMDIIVAGAQEHGLDTVYIEFLKSFPTKPDPDELRALMGELIISQSRLTKKTFDPTISLMQAINRESRYIIELPGHVLNGKIAHLTKDKTEFFFQTEAEVIKGPQDHKDLNLSGHRIRLVDSIGSWIVEGKDLLINNVQYTDNHRRLLFGGITSLRSIAFNPEATTFYRVIIPVQAYLRNSRDYESSGFRTMSGVGSGVITVEISGKTFQFYNTKISKNFLLFIDGLTPTTLEEFQRVCNAILLTYAFLSGSYHAGQGYFFSYTDERHQEPTGVLFHTLSTVEGDGHSIFSTNPFIGIDEKTLECDEKGALTPEASKKLYEGIKFFPVKVFSKICELTFTSEKLLRTLTLLINNRSSNLEMKIPLQYVTLETITAVLSRGNKELKPLADEDGEELLNEIKKSIEEFCLRKAINPETKDYLLKKVQYINSPANVDKLSKSFAVVGYTLSAEEKKAVKQRNSYLHGSIVSLIGTKVDAKELFHLSLRLHFLIAVLLLKHAGFSGKIINHAQLYSHITGKDLKEDVFRAI